LTEKQEAKKGTTGGGDDLEQPRSAATLPELTGGNDGTLGRESPILGGKIIRVGGEKRGTEKGRNDETWESFASGEDFFDAVRTGKGRRRGECQSGETYCLFSCLLGAVKGKLQKGGNEGDQCNYWPQKKFS